MGYREIFDRIDAGRLDGIFVFRGPEEYVKDKALEALKAKLAPEGLGDLNYQYLEGERANAGEIRHAVETLPFMADMRLVVVRDYPMLAASSRGSGLDASKEAEELDRLISDFPKTACLVFLQRVPPDRTRSAWKQLIKIAEDVEFAPLTEDELVQQLGKIAKRCGCTMNRSEALFMLQYCGSELEALSREMEKTCAHAGPGAAVSRADIGAVCVQAQESKVFGFIDLLFDGKTSGAMAQLRRLDEDDEGAPALLSLVERQARLMLTAKAEGAGAGMNAAAALLGVKPFVMDLAKRQAARWTAENLSRIISMCAEADMDVKQGRMDIQTSVEKLVMNIVWMTGKK